MTKLTDQAFQDDYDALCSEVKKLEKKGVRIRFMEVDDYEVMQVLESGDLPDDTSLVDFQCAFYWSGLVPYAECGKLVSDMSFVEMRQVYAKSILLSGQESLRDPLPASRKESLRSDGRDSEFIKRLEDERLADAKATIKTAEKILADVHLKNMPKDERLVANHPTALEVYRFIKSGEAEGRSRATIKEGVDLAKQSMNQPLLWLEELSLITRLPPVKGNGRGRPQVVYVATCCQTEELTEAESL